MKTKIEFVVESKILPEGDIYLYTNYIPGVLYLVNNKFLVMASKEYATVNVLPVYELLNQSNTSTIDPEEKIVVREDFVLKLIAMTQNREKYKDLK
jgi:hypothetical protein